MPLATPDAQEALHELQVHQIELEMEVNELRRTQEALDTARTRYFDFYDLAPVGYCSVSEKGLISQANLSAAALLGIARQDLVQQPFSRFVAADEQDRFYLFCRQLLDSGDALNCELRLVNAAGTTFWAQLAALAVPEDNAQRALRLVISDISVRKQAQAQLATSQMLLVDALAQSQAILESMISGVITIDAHGLIETFNPAASRIFGYTFDEVHAHNVSMLMPEPYRSAHDSYLQRYQASGESHIIGQTRTVQGQRKDGSVFPLSLSVSQTTQDGRVTFVGITRDISQQQRDAQEIEHLAFYDTLTGLPNRRLLLDRLQQALLNSARTGLHGGLMFLDLDNFKQVNDTLGHDVGDLLLQQTAQRLQACVREGDSVSRLSGDEFVLLLEGLSSEAHEAAAQAQASAHKLLAAVSQPYGLREHEANCSASIGIVVFAGAAQSVMELLKRADVAMYQAKDAGRNTLRFFDAAMQAAVLAHNARIADLKRGLTQHEFVLHYQIQVNQQGTPIGVEALARWQHATRGLVSPAEFIALAEETRLILPLGQWLLEAACAQMAAWAAQPQTARWTMSVNVSALQFAQAEFIDGVRAALQKTGATPGLLKLELTESMLVGDIDAVIAKMTTLNALGVRFELDDFGTGFSSLSYMQRLPLERLKIDQSFVHDLVTNPNSAIIARTIVALGHGLGLQVIAEGVETAAQREMLTSKHCDAFQGYWFGRPVAVSELARFISK